MTTTTTTTPITAGTETLTDAQVDTSSSNKIGTNSIQDSPNSNKTTTKWSGNIFKGRRRSRQQQQQEQQHQQQQQQQRLSNATAITDAVTTTTSRRQSQPSSQSQQPRQQKQQQQQPHRRFLGFGKWRKPENSTTSSTSSHHAPQQQHVRQQSHNANNTNDRSVKEQPGHDQLDKQNNDLFDNGQDQDHDDSNRFTIGRTPSSSAAQRISSSSHSSSCSSRHAPPSDRIIGAGLRQRIHRWGRVNEVLPTTQAPYTSNTASTSSNSRSTRVGGPIGSRLIDNFNNNTHQNNTTHNSHTNRISSTSSRYPSIVSSLTASTSLRGGSDFGGGTSSRRSMMLFGGPFESSAASLSSSTSLSSFRNRMSGSSSPSRRKQQRQRHLGMLRGHNKHNSRNSNRSMTTNAAIQRYYEATARDNIDHGFLEELYHPNHHHHHPNHHHHSATHDMKEDMSSSTTTMAATSSKTGTVCSSSRFFATANDLNTYGNGGVGSSGEFKIYVEVDRVSIVDNANQHGIYTGTLDRLHHKPHGIGTMIYSQETLVYDGQWVKGDWCGFGSLIDTKNGHTYQGGFFDNYKHGLGVLTYSDGRIYECSFTLGTMELKGHLEYPDGTKYWGHWTSDGVEHGRGKKEFVDGRVFDGEFENGIIHGHGRMTYPDGSWYLGEWMDGEQNGMGMYVKANGTLHSEGTFYHGKPIEASSCPTFNQKSDGDFLLYRSSVAPHGTLVGNIPQQVTMRPDKLKWAL